MLGGYCPNCNATLELGEGLTGNVNVVNSMILSGTCKRCDGRDGKPIPKGEPYVQYHNNATPQGICPTCKTSLELGEGLTSNIEVLDGKVLTGYCKRCDPNLSLPFPKEVES
jgi:RNase P subunit RPR2